MYDWVKALHMGAAVLSVAGFALRGMLMLSDSPWLRWKPVRVLPHIVDTVLLGAAIYLAWALAQYPFVHGWLTAKVLALLVYIGLGMVALRFGRSRFQRALAFGGALLAAAYLFSVAFTKEVFPL